MKSPANRKTVYTECIICGKPFLTSPWQKARLCSTECRGIYRKLISRKHCICKNCGGPFSVNKSRDGVYCSKKCAGEYRRSRIEAFCNECGKKFELRKCEFETSKNHFCSRKCMGAWNSRNKVGNLASRWKTGKYVTPYGYIMLNLPKKEKEFEHRAIMERVLGRKLTREEIVHHINMDKQDNRPENLAIMTQKEHIELHRRLGTI